MPRSTGAYFSTTSPPVLDATVTVPSEKVHDDAAWAAAARASSVGAVRKRMVVRGLRLLTANSEAGEDSLGELPIKGYVVVRGVAMIGWYDCWHGADYVREELCSLRVVGRLACKGTAPVFLLHI